VLFNAPWAGQKITEVTQDAAILIGEGQSDLGPAVRDGTLAFGGFQRSGFKHSLSARTAGLRNSHGIEGATAPISSCSFPLTQLDPQPSKVRLLLEGEDGKLFNLLAIHTST
jgi:hypothetical protein